MPVDLVGPDGQQYELDNEDPAALDEALRQGFKQPLNTAEVDTGALGAIEDVGDAAVAGTLGAVEGVTGGLFGAALGRSDLGVGKQLVTTVKEQNPIAAGVGELAGMVASPLNAVGGGVTKAVGATTRLGRIGAEALGSGVTNMLFGAGKELSDASLGDHQLTAEKLIAGAGLGGLLGLAGGGIGGALSEGLSAAGTVISKPLANAKDALLDIRDTFGMKAAGAMGKEFKAAAHRGNTRELVDLLVEKGVMKPGGKVDDVAEAAAQLVKQTDAEKVALEKALEAKGAVVDGAKAADEIEKLAAKYAKGNVGDQSIAKRLTAEADALRARGEMPFSSAEDAKRGFDKYLKFGAEQSPMQEGLKQARGILNRVNEEAAGKVGGDDVARWLKAKKETGLLAQVSDFSSARAEALKANRTISLTDYIAGGGGGVVGAIAGGDENRLEGALTGAGLALGNKMLRERLPSLIAKAADSLAKSPALTAIAQSFTKSLPQLAPKMGAYSSQLIRAAAQSPAHALATHMAYAQADPQYQAAAQLAGLIPEAPDEHEAAMGRAHGLARVAGAVQHQDDQVSRHLDQVFRGTKAPKAPAAMKSQDFGSKRMRRDDAASYQKRVEEIRQLATDPNALVDRIAGNAGPLGSVAPGVTAAMTASAQRAVQYLAKASEEPPKAGPLAASWVPTEAERYAFAQKLEAVQDPMSVFRHAAAGTLTEDQVEAFRAVYPTLAKQAADKALEKVATAKNVPYHSMVMLSLLTGVDMDGSMSQEAIAANQRAIHATVEEPAVPSPGTQQSEMTLASRLATPSQRQEMDE